MPPKKKAPPKKEKPAVHRPPKKAPPKKITMEENQVVGEGVFDMPNLPGSVQQFYGKVKDKNITKMEVFRRPVGDAIEGALNAFTGNSVDKFFKQTPYDKLFHLGIIINEKFLFHKQEVVTLEKIPGGYKRFLKGKDMETSPVSDFGDITIKNLFRRTREKMGDKKFYGYDAMKNNCQDFVVTALESVGAKFDKEFIKQNLEQLAEKIPSFTQKVGNAFVGFANRARRLVGLGAGFSKQKEKKEPRYDDDDGGDPSPRNANTSVVGRSVQIMK